MLIFPPMSLGISLPRACCFSDAIAFKRFARDARPCKQCFVAYTNSPPTFSGGVIGPLLATVSWLFSAHRETHNETSGLLSVTPEKMIEANGYVSAGGI